MTVKENLLNAHATKTLDEELLDLSLLQNGKVMSSGNGKLFVSPDGRLQIEVNAEYLPFPFRLTTPGMIISENEFFEINAKTRDNLTLKASRLYAKNTSHGINKPAQILFETGQVTFLSNVTTQAQSSFDVYISPFDCNFLNRSCADGEANPVFGDNVSGLWLSIETAEMVIGLRKDSDSWVHFKVNSKAAGINIIEKHAVAFLNALRFRVGKCLECLAYSQTTAKEEEIVLLNHRPNGERKFYQPLPDYEREATEKLLTCAMNFFLKEKSSPIFTALNVCWESRKVTFAAGNLLVCSVVEGLADYILKDAKEECGRLRDLALELLRNESKAKESLYFEKVEKCIKGVEFFSDRETIRRAGELLKITITDTELKAWGLLRHRLAHGNFSFDFQSQDTMQSEIDRANCVANIVNKFILALIRYEGVFCDYSVRGHPPCKFPL